MRRMWREYARRRDRGISASAVTAEIGDPKRFKNEKVSCFMVRAGAINMPISMEKGKV